MWWSFEWIMNKSEKKCETEAVSCLPGWRKQEIQKAQGELVKIIDTFTNESIRYFRQQSLYPDFPLYMQDTESWEKRTCGRRYQRGTTGFCIWKGIQRVEKMVKLCNIVDNILYGYEPRNSTNPGKPLEIPLIKSYIITRKRNKIFGVGCKSQPAV